MRTLIPLVALGAVAGVAWLLVAAWRARGRDDVEGLAYRTLFHVLTCLILAAVILGLIWFVTLVAQRLD